MSFPANTHQLLNTVMVNPNVLAGTGNGAVPCNCAGTGNGAGTEFGAGVPMPFDNRITQVMANFDEQLMTVHSVISNLHADLLSQPLPCDEVSQCEPRSLQDFLSDGPQWLNMRLMPIYNKAQELRDKLISPM